MYADNGKMSSSPMNGRRHPVRPKTRLPTEILIAEKKHYLKRLDIQELTEEIIQSREEISEQIKALKAFEKMCAGYGFDVTKPAKDAREAVQFVYLGYLAAVKDQDGAAMSLGRTSTFLDIYIEKDKFLNIESFQIMFLFSDQDFRTVKCYTAVVTDNTSASVRKREINVRDFIQNNYKPYEGDDSFLKDSSDKTKKVWDKLTEMFKVEREKGVYDAETKYPQGIDTYGPGYIDKENEVIVGLQTDAPLKRGIYPKCGTRMVENSLEAYGYKLDPMTKSRKSRPLRKVCSCSG